jgi:hypothetical protein
MQAITIKRMLGAMTTILVALEQEYMVQQHLKKLLDEDTG